MNYATFAALINYDTITAALAANAGDGDAWLLNETQVFQDGRMPKSGPAAVKNNSQTQKASSLTPTISRNRASSSGTVGAGYQSSLQDNPAGVNNKETVANDKAPAIRHKVSWYVTDTSLTAGYRRVFGVLEDPTTTDSGRDDDNQVRI